MNFVEWIFLGFNGVLSIAGIIYYGKIRTGNGVLGLLTPAGWGWIWQAIGVIIIPFILGWSVWHLLWWFPLGFVVCPMLWKILYRFGAVHM